MSNEEKQSEGLDACPKCGTEVTTAGSHGTGARREGERLPEATMQTAHHLAHLTGRPLVVTHGNGPQVGSLLLRSDLAAGVVPGG